MYWFVAVSLLFLSSIRCCHGVPQHSEEAHLGLEGPSNVAAKSGEAAISGSMMRSESSHSRRVKQHSGGGTMFEVKPSGELKYRSGASGAAPVIVSTTDAMGKDDVANVAMAGSLRSDTATNRDAGLGSEVPVVSQNAGVDVVVIAVSNEDSKKENGTVHNTSGLHGLQSASGADGPGGSPRSDSQNSTVHADHLALVMEQLALLHDGEQTEVPVRIVPAEEAKAVEGERMEQLPGERFVGELFQEGVQTSSKNAAQQAKAEEGGAQIPGMGNVGDLAFRAMDMMLGTTGIIAEDYPFACICNEYGVCERDIQNTPCPHRAGQMAAAHRSVSNGATIFVLATAVFTVRIWF